MALNSTSERVSWNTATIKHGGLLLKADENDHLEEEGILNPAVAGDYLLYRSVSKGNYSRILAAKLKFGKAADGLPIITAQKMKKIALEPQESYEKGLNGRGGVEDPRITKMADGQYVMLYIGFGLGIAALEQAPILALATSKDGLDWERKGRLDLGMCERNGNLVNLNQVANKDAVLFSSKINGRYAMFHRPMFSAAEAEVLGVPLLGIWYAEADNLTGPWDSHKFIFGPSSPWENYGVGAGVPPIAYEDLWFNIYHGFYQSHFHKHYSVGLFVTKKDSPTDIVFRSREPLLTPPTPAKKSHIVFPTAVWPLEDLKNTWAIFWGDSDTSIHWGLFTLGQ